MLATEQLICVVACEEAFSLLLSEMANVFHGVAGFFWPALFPNKTHYYNIEWSACIVTLRPGKTHFHII